MINVGRVIKSLIHSDEKNIYITSFTEIVGYVHSSLRKISKKIKTQMYGLRLSGNCIKPRKAEGEES